MDGAAVDNRGISETDTVEVRGADEGGVKSGSEIIGASTADVTTTVEEEVVVAGEEVTGIAISTAAEKEAAEIGAVIVATVESTCVTVSTAAEEKAAETAAETTGDEATVLTVSTTAEEEAVETGGRGVDEVAGADIEGTTPDDVITREVED